MKLWTIRPESDWLLLQRHGVFVSEPRYVMPDRLAAYRWMAARLAEKTPAPAGVELPVWAWYRAHGQQRPKPDLRKRGFLEPGQQGVRMELDVPDELVLLSSFDGWHAVLNNWFFTLGDAEYEHAERLEASLPPDALAREKARSWHRIFDLGLLPDPALYEVQAVFWQLNLAHVTQVEFFTAR